MALQRCGKIQLHLWTHKESCEVPLTSLQPAWCYLILQHHEDLSSPSALGIVERRAQGYRCLWYAQIRPCLLFEHRSYSCTVSTTLMLAQLCSTFFHLPAVKNNLKPKTLKKKSTHSLSQRQSVQTLQACGYKYSVFFPSISVSCMLINKFLAGCWNISVIIFHESKGYKQFSLAKKNPPVFVKKKKNSCYSTSI